MKKIAILVALLSGAVFNPAIAAVKTIELQSFTALNAQKGINLIIKCAENPSLKVKGTQSAIDKLNINNDAGTLNLFNETTKKDNILSQTLDITLYTNNPLNNLSTKAGIKIKVDTCAVDSEKMAISGAMGSKIDVEGKTKHLDLNLAAGAVFNQTSAKFSADSAKVDLSMGAHASLCHIPQITGSLTAGTKIDVDKKADVKITNNFASEISTDSCS
ncbi:hypothetical protein FE394_02985 [Xenorhabdus sp. Reich]|uniref:Putative auto-transporter adhesin head GIN domain-containing protein n=1 Tax=Xenorhabdus littoralis TaxID=2582835 RepID=A0ABU4SHR3_9GAMM|nr:DUF2807 domain-containing protein [Xenorhabdus sp. Reich]MDX7998187.1 hypothetical protein [Xenorhabdus sp. Reich]